MNAPNLGGAGVQGARDVIVTEHLGDLTRTRHAPLIARARVRVGAWGPIRDGGHPADAATHMARVDQAGGVHLHTAHHWLDDGDTLCQACSRTLARIHAVTEVVVIAVLIDLTGADVGSRCAEPAAADVPFGAFDAFDASNENTNESIRSLAERRHQQSR